MRHEFPAKVMVAAFKRAQDKCESCGAPLTVGKFHYDHVIPDAMGGTPTLDNCAVLCMPCHSAKTRTKDQPAIAKAKRLERRQMGIKKRTGFWKPKGARYDWSAGKWIVERNTP